MTEPPLHATALQAAAALACNAGSAALVLGRMAAPSKPPPSSSRPRLLLLLTTLGAAAAWTAVQHWTAASDLDDADEGSTWASASPGLVLAVQLLLTLAACQALSTIAALKRSPLHAVLGPLLVLLPLAQLDALSAAVLCAASLALRAATALTPSTAAAPPLVATAAPALALLSILLSLDDELRGAPGVASWWPDAGAWWYLMTETFHGFQPYFRLVLAAHPFLYLAPLSIRLAGSKSSKGKGKGKSEAPAAPERRERMFLLVAVAIAHVFRPRPQTAHTAAAMAAFFLLLHAHSGDSSGRGAALHRLRFKLLLCAAGLSVPAVLMPTMAHLWLRARAGNANYLFFQGYVWNVFLSLLLLEMVLALLRLDDHDHRGGGQEQREETNRR